MEPGQANELATAVRELRAVVTAQSAEIAELRSQLAALARPRPAPIDEVPMVTGRRRFLAMAGGAAAVAAGTLVGDVRPVAAANTNPVTVGDSVQASPGVPLSTVLDYSPTSGAQADYLRVTDQPGAVSIDVFYARYLPAAVAGHVRTTPDRLTTGVTGLSEVEGGNGVLGIATGANGSYGVWGVSETGNGVVGRSLLGYDFFGGGAGRIGLSEHVFVGPPTGDTIYAAGDIIRDSQGALWACVVSGAPGVWRKLAGPTTAGSFHPVTPRRVYDSRSPSPDRGLLASGSARTISVAHGRDTQTGRVTVSDLVPPGATAVACNITVTDTFGSGFAVVNPGIDAEIGSSTINWQPGQVLANAVIVGVDDDRRLTLVAGGGGVTNIVVDVSGYFR